MKLNINPKSQLSPIQSTTLQRAQELRAKVEDVKDAINKGPSDLFQDVTSLGERSFDSERYRGSIGKHQFGEASLSRTESGQIKNLVAFDAPVGSNEEGQSVKFFLVKSEATGLRAVFSGMLGGIAGFVGGVAATLMAKGWETAAKGDSGLRNAAATVMCSTAQGIGFVAGATEHFGNFVADSGARDALYTQSNSDNSHQTAQFRSDGRVDYESWKPEA
jgi:hypothetical protein